MSVAKFTPINVQRGPAVTELPRCGTSDGRDASIVTSNCPRARKKRISGPAPSQKIVEDSQVPVADSKERVLISKVSSKVAHRLGDIDDSANTISLFAPFTSMQALQSQNKISSLTIQSSSAICQPSLKHSAIFLQTSASVEHHQIRVPATPISLHQPSPHGHNDASIQYQNAQNIDDDGGDLDLLPEDDDIRVQLEMLDQCPPAILSPPDERDNLHMNSPNDRITQQQQTFCRHLSDIAPCTFSRHPVPPQICREELAPDARSSAPTNVDDDVTILSEDDAELEEAMQACEHVDAGPDTPSFVRDNRPSACKFSGGIDHARATEENADMINFESMFNSTAESAKSPIVRMPFPSPILGRSPILGASNTTTLRVCFRIGEAINAISQSLRADRQILLELYARVTKSWRESTPYQRQGFVFKDLYHDKPPFLTGTFHGWNESRLRELDSRAFLTHRPEGVRCRIIARINRKAPRQHVQILSIWEASWVDVEDVAGIHAATVDNID